MFTPAQRTAASVSVDLSTMFCIRCSKAHDDLGVMLVANTDISSVGTFLCQRCIDRIQGRETTA